MTKKEIRDLYVELLDDIHELSQDPIADPEPLKGKIESFLRRVEAEIGEKDNGE